MRDKFNYSENELVLNKVIKSQQDDLLKLQEVNKESQEVLGNRIKESENLLKELGYDLPNKSGQPQTNSNDPIIMRNWEDIANEANEKYSSTITFNDIFTLEELESNEEYIIKLRNEFNNIHKLDLIDWSIPILAGILSSIINIVLVGIPQKTANGLSAGPLSNYIRNLFEKAFSPDEMEKLANKKFVKVPFDAQYNKYTVIDVEGLSTYYHRLLSLGHDPLLAFIVGVLDVLNGTMTTIDKKGRIVVQAIEQYADRKETSLFAAIAKVFLHLASDVNTSMGLPVPLMGLFNLCQFGKIGDEQQTIAEIVQGMYYEGYDFVHFCSMSIPTMLIEVIVRISYGIKRKCEGFKNYIPIINSREIYPKLGTELFISHTIATGINAGYVYFSKNPLAINYAQWIMFVENSFSQLKWVLIKKPNMRYKYVQNYIDEEWDEVYTEVENTWDCFSKNKTIIYA